MSSPPPLSPRGAEEVDEDGAARSDGTGSGGGGGTVFCYGEAGYWDARYVEEGGAPYDWYQRYAALRPFVRRFVPPASRLLMIGCGSARTSPASSVCMCALCYGLLICLALPQVECSFLFSSSPFGNLLKLCVIVICEFG